MAASLGCSSHVEQPRSARGRVRTELGVFMKTELNPPFSKLSFLLFHGDDGGDVDPAALPAAASELALASEKLGQWKDAPGDSEQGKLVFYEYAEALKSDADSLAGAITSKDKAGAIKVFESLRKKCDSCHHFFRFDETVALPVAPLLIAELR